MGRPIDMQSALEVAETYVLARQGGITPISTSDAVRYLRKNLGRSAESDRDLAELVARCAIRHGMGVSFDSPGIHRGF